jgi:hypothetical protein
MLRVSAQPLVARKVTEVVVYILESVEIEKEHSEQIVGMSSGSSHRMPKALSEE